MMRKEPGFTLIELVVVVSVVSILSVVLSDFFAGRLIDSTRTQTRANLQANTREAMEVMEKDIKAAHGVEDVNRWADVNSPGGAMNPYSWTSNTTTLVLAIPAQDTNGNLLYVDVLRNILQTNDVVYYIDPVSKILYRRTVANPVSGNAAKTTCPPQLASESCPRDGKVVEDVAELTAIYFNNSGVYTATPAEAGSIELTLKQSRKRLGKTYNSILTSRATLRNR